MTERPSLPATRPLVSGFLKQHLGGASVVRSYYDRDESHVVAVVEATGTPDEVLSSYATASLHAQPNHLEGADIRVELLIVAAAELEEAPNVVATAAFNVMKDGWLVAPGVVYPNAVSEYYPTATTPHVMWIEPVDFAGLSTVQLDGLDADVHWLQAVPITEAERHLLLSEGFDALSRTLERVGVRHFDFFRSSVC